MRFCFDRLKSFDYQRNNHQWHRCIKVLYERYKILNVKLYIKFSMVNNIQMCQIIKIINSRVKILNFV